jgi:hypothetical protein
MKIGKNLKLFMILILFFAIVFVLLGHFNVFKEGHASTAPKCTNSEINDDDSQAETDDYFLSTKLVPPVCPTCPYYEPSNLTGHDEYHKKQFHDFSSYGVSGEDAYMAGLRKASYLDSVFGKSGPNSNNTDSNNNNKNSNNTSVDNKDSNNTTVGSNNTQSQTQNLTQQSQTNKINTDNSTNNSTNTNTDNSVSTNQVSQDSSVNQDMSQTQTTTQTSDSKFNNLLGNNSIMLGSFGGGGSGSNTVTQTANNPSGLMPVSSPETVNSTSLTPYDKVKTSDPETLAMINDMKATITKLNQQANENKETCPPCPACERCPEPAFECKKVPNYRSPSIDNYMPVPVLNDFSKF